MQKHKKKVWKKNKILELEVGSCRYCNENIMSTDAFVSFLSRDHAHYKCMKEDDEKKATISDRL